MSLLKDYSPLCVTLHLSYQEFCDIFQCPYLASNIKLVHNSPWKWRNIRCSRRFLTGTFPMYILWVTVAFLSSPLHDMHVRKLRIRITTHVFQICADNDYSSQRIAFIHWTEELLLLPSFMHLCTLHLCTHIHMKYLLILAFCISFNFLDT